MSESERVQRWRQRQREAGKEPLTIWLTTTEKLRLEDMALTQRCSPSELVSRMLAQWHGEPQAITDTVTDTEQIRFIVQHELARTQTVTDTVTDTVTATLEQTLPALVRALLSEQQPGSVTATVTDTVADTSLSPGPGSAMDTDPGGATDTVTDTVADTSTSPGDAPRAAAAPACVADTVTATVTDTDSTPTAKRKASARQRSVTAPVSATVTVTEPKHRGRPPVLREPILALLREYPNGLTAAQLKVYLDTEKPIGDTLAGMVKAELLVKDGSGKAVRYLRAL